jgi:hypothetical protein
VQWASHSSVARVHARLRGRRFPHRRRAQRRLGTAAAAALPSVQHIQQQQQHNITTHQQLAGSFNIKPKKARLLSDYSDGRDLTKLINASNEAEFASKAQQAGGTLKTVKAPPVLAPAHMKKKPGKLATGGKGGSGGGGDGIAFVSPMQE